MIVGGGATGLGAALDAVARGLWVVLVESHDFVKGSSSRSTKLVHGGVRYLAQGRIGLVREALRERATLQNNAPHLAQALRGGVKYWDRQFDDARLAVALARTAAIHAALLMGLPGARTTLCDGLSEAVIRYSARHEYALTVEDVLARRFRLLFQEAGQARDPTPRVGGNSSTGNRWRYSSG